MTLRVALAQVNPTVGDLEGNARTVRDTLRTARERGASLVLLPELVLTGYPPQDLLFVQAFLRRQEELLREIARDVKGFAALVGFARGVGGRVTNAAAVLNRGEVKEVYDKVHLPNYGVFDEKRYFQPGRELLALRLPEGTAGVTICEDIWESREITRRLSAELGADLILNLSSSPFHAGKWRERRELVSEQARRAHCFFAYVNLVGGQDELVFDGGSFVTGPDGDIIAQALPFEEDILLVDLDLRLAREGKTGGNVRKKAPDGSDPGARVVEVALEETETPPLRPAPGPVPPPGFEEEIYGALVLGTRDYVRKNSFTDVVIGLSGGVDSALVATVAADALESGRVHCVAMPSPYSSKESLEDARLLAGNLGTDFLEIPITRTFGAFQETFAPVFAGREEDVTEENIQARIRGNILMALSNKFGWLVLTTGNKSEVSMGYSTLYGDTAGGFAVIKDVFKTTVYRLCRWRNQKAGRSLIPEAILLKPPSAELKPGQADSDSLPPYEVLDPVLIAYVEENRTADEITESGLDPGLVRSIVNQVDRSEFKRRQNPPGVKITPRSFGRDRRMPITNRFRC
jgi:NAD+ synthase (glutamine-hydrolysing)